jgi:hypothetical protein
VPVCEFCDAFMERIANAKPHSALVGAGARCVATGVVEQFECSECGTKWERFHTNRLYRGKPQYWKIIRRTGFPDQQAY